MYAYLRQLRQLRALFRATKSPLCAVANEYGAVRRLESGQDPRGVVQWIASPNGEMKEVEKYIRDCLEHTHLAAAMRTDFDGELVFSFSPSQSPGGIRKSGNEGRRGRAE